MKPRRFERIPRHYNGFPQCKTTKVEPSVLARLADMLRATPGRTMLVDAPIDVALVARQVAPDGSVIHFRPTTQPPHLGASAKFYLTSSLER